jgi:hypothetical protein
MRFRTSRFYSSLDADSAQIYTAHSRSTFSNIDRPLLPSANSATPYLLLPSLEQDQSRQSYGVTEDLYGGDGGSEGEDGTGDEELQSMTGW